MPTPTHADTGLQRNTQGYGGRPFGVGMLVCGADHTGPHIYRSDPNAEVTECTAMAIGGRSQSARTYLEKHLGELADCDLQALIQHALLALRDTIPPEEDLSAQNTSIGVATQGETVRILEDDAVAPYIDRIQEVPRARQPGAARAAPAQPGQEPAEPMQQ